MGGHCPPIMATLTPMEAVKQGSATVGLKSNDYAIIVALNFASFRWKNSAGLPT